MRCNCIDDCFEQISAYFNGKKTGHYFLINAENYDLHQELLQRLEADGSSTCIYVSDYSLPNGLPDVETAEYETTTDGKYVLIGMSPALLLRGSDAAEKKLDELLGKRISGHCVVILDHCETILSKFLSRDIRLENRIVLIESETSHLPKIRLTMSESKGIDTNQFLSFSMLINYLIHMNDNDVKNSPEVSVVCSFKKELFANSFFSVEDALHPYEILSAKYSDISGATELSYGTREQWEWLLSQVLSFSSFSAFVSNLFGTTNNLISCISSVFSNKESNNCWLYWLSLKVFEEKSNQYINEVIQLTNSFDSFEDEITMHLLNLDHNDKQFSRKYQERKKIIELLPENLPLINAYCEKVGVKGRNAVYYLTDSSDVERLTFIKLLCTYDYTKSEILNATKIISNNLYLYLKNFKFDSINTRLSDSDSEFRAELTNYFDDYKYQKITNTIYSSFIDKVNTYALQRPYNRLLPRSSVVAHMDRKDAQLFFFDALGVEYLSFILSKCEEYGLSSETHIAHCELPSITSQNKEFIQYFPEGSVYKIDALDEMKHHSQFYNYEKCEYPIHLFEELDVIEEELRKIHSMLVQGIISKAIIVSDHGASRLAVQYGKYSDLNIQLDEKGEHSGRCCKIDENPDLPYAAYEDGFSVLANYERFKGGRRANVEVHGGATLEEVLVPIITLSKKPEGVEICFTNPIVELKPREIPTITLFTNIPLKAPRLLINGDYYDGEFEKDKKLIKFSLNSIKRKGNYTAEVMDGEKKLSIKLDFVAQKNTHEVNLL